MCKTSNAGSEFFVSPPDNRLWVLDVGGLLPLGSLCHVKTYLLAFLERFKTVHADRGKVRKQIIAAIIRSDKTKTFCVVEPFHCTDCHVIFSLSKKCKINYGFFALIGCDKTILTPKAICLIAFAAAGSGKTGEVAFFGLDHSYQFGFCKFAGFDAAGFGNFPHFFHFHVEFPNKLTCEFDISPPRQ
jgi:hypothetical protein